MRTRKIILSLVLIFAAAAVAAPSFVHAMDSDSTLATFNQPVGIPGKVLPAGTYLFQSYGPVVQVWDADREKLYATLMTIPAFRRDSDNDSEFEFEERADGAPMAIDAWYFDGGTIGEEFVYPDNSNIPAPPLPNSTFAKDPSTRWWVEEK